MSIPDLVGAGWREHAKDPAGVFDRMRRLVAEARAPGDVAPLAGLLTHVAGEHLGRFEEGLASLDALAARPACAAGSVEAKLVGRQKAALLFAAGRAADAEACLARSRSDAFPPASDRVRALAVAASALAGLRRTEEARDLFEEALSLAAYGPTASDPAAKALAITGNNLATELENRPVLDAAETALMLRAARAGLDFWRVAGTWLEEGRAEYRLSSSLRKAGDAAAALRHAARYLGIVEAHPDDASERFSAHEALARARLLGGDRTGARRDRDAAASALPAVEDASWREVLAQDLSALDASLGTPA